MSKRGMTNETKLPVWQPGSGDGDLVELVHACRQALLLLDHPAASSVGVGGRLLLDDHLVELADASQQLKYFDRNGIKKTFSLFCLRN